MNEQHSPEIPNTAGPAPEGRELDAALDASVAVLQAERDECHDKLLRAHAELDNFRKRAQRERDEERRFSVGPIARDLLPVLDNLRRAVDAASQGGSVEDLQAGVAMVLKQAEEVLEKHHVAAIQSVGLPFDPNHHEAITQMPSEQHPPLTVLQEVERGYRLHDRILRPSKVIVSAAPNS